MLFVTPIVALVLLPQMTQITQEELARVLKPWWGFYLVWWFAVFVTQVIGYYKLAKVSRNLLLFRCVAFPYVADAILSLIALIAFKDPISMLSFKSLSFFLYAYYDYRLFAELSRVTQDHVFKNGIILIGIGLTLSLLVLVGAGDLGFLVLGLLFLVGALAGWGMIFMGFVRLKEISYP
ncbi:phosphatidylglycerophosphate synthase [Helicobacter salomonis]|uniref:phosphatidylglycerophosphate synthase n=1 Tax=Helicobacter salomonis TaxID=56878 RepID=UPI001F43DF82|nr:phosphatidylglycerophosphate synthase [Helicobacter salomonis]